MARMNREIVRYVGGKTIRGTFCGECAHPAAWTNPKAWEATAAVTMPVILTQPQSTDAKDGDRVTILAKVQGATSFRWQYSSGNGTWKYFTSDLPTVLGQFIRIICVESSISGLIRGLFAQFSDGLLLHDLSCAATHWLISTLHLQTNKSRPPCNAWFWIVWYHRIGIYNQLSIAYFRSGNTAWL